MVFDKDSKNPIYDFLNKKYFINNFKTQKIFQTCLRKLYLTYVAQMS